MPDQRRWSRDGITYFERGDRRTIWVDIHVEGRRFKRSTRETTRQAAERAGRRIRVELEAELHAAPPLADHHLFLETWAREEIRRTREAAKHPATVSAQISRWVQIVRHLGTECRLTDIDVPKLRWYQRQRRDIDGTRAQTIVREWGAIRRCFVMALEQREVQEHREVADYLRNMLAVWPRMVGRDPKSDTLKGHLRTADQIRAVCTLASEDLQDILLFALMTGLRRGELLRLEFGWIREAPAGFDVAAVLKLPDESAKTDQGGGVVGLSSLALDIAHRRFEEVQDLGARLFHTGCSKQLRRINRELHIDPPVKLRDMRTTHVTWSKQGAGLDAAQASARHSDPRTTMAYLRENDFSPAALKAVTAVSNRFDPAPTHGQDSGQPAHPTGTPTATVEPVPLFVVEIKPESGTESAAGDGGPWPRRPRVPCHGADTGASGDPGAHAGGRGRTGSALGTATDSAVTS